MMDEPVKEARLTRRQWSVAAGFFFKRFADMVRACDDLYVALLTLDDSKLPGPRQMKRPSANWHHRPIAQRMEKLAALIEKVSKTYPADVWPPITARLAEVDALISARNTLAHGSLALDAERGEGGFVVVSMSQRKPDGSYTERSKVIHCFELTGVSTDLMELELDMLNAVRHLESTGLISRPAQERKLTRDQHYAEATLSLQMGHFFIAMGYVDMLLASVYHRILGIRSSDDADRPTSLAGEFLDTLTLSQRLEDVAARVPFDDQNVYLHEVLKDIKASNLVDERNFLAHAEIGHIPGADGQLELVAIRNHRKGPEWRSGDEVRRLIELSCSLADSLSEALVLTHRPGPPTN